MGSDIPLQAVRQQIASGIDLMVHLGRMRDKSRKLLEISEILGMEAGEIQIQKLYEFHETGEENGRVMGEWQRRNVLQSQDKLWQKGLRLFCRES